MGSDVSYSGGDGERRLGTPHHPNGPDYAGGCIFAQLWSRTDGGLLIVENA